MVSVGGASLVADTVKSSPNGFRWDTASEAYAEGRDGKPSRYSALSDYQQWVDWLHGRLARNEIFRHG